MPAFLKSACLCAVSAAGLLLVTACGGGSGGSGGQTDATQLDLCSVLTAAQIKQAIGMEVGPGTGADAPAVGCSWLATGDSLSTVTLLYTEPSTYDAMKQITAQAGMKVTKVDGVGDEAYAEYDSLTAAPLLYIKKGSTIVFVSADIMAGGTTGRVPQAQDLAADKQLGTIIAGAL
ncbi:MAG TPA: hypothetical protein VGZ32_26375 [Actinocrinis sp.]|jgi:hypothetical protein|uniref:hypothetical protein n=1 Tax=Actinocrinis sp. TaxID=1920516 RepID=UPI002DDD6557|nr:hypothetical protein [Actinocrinis sp.]HEV3173906.1 hypothetical protein [Actinocrinis sp.]